VAAKREHAFDVGHINAAMGMTGRVNEDHAATATARRVTALLIELDTGHRFFIHRSPSLSQHLDKRRATTVGKAPELDGRVGGTR